MQQRYYDPLIGRLLSRDEVTAYEKPLTNFNAYVYALNNPYRFTDPDGRDSASCYSDGGCGGNNSFYPSHEDIGEIANFTPVIGDIKGFVDAYNEPSIVNVAAAIIGLVPEVGDVVGAEIRAAGKEVAAAERAKNFSRGIPESQLGPSGKPKIHTVDHGGKRGEAKEAARRESGKGGRTENHTNPKEGKDHYHGVSQSGEKSRVHHEYGQ